MLGVGEGDEVIRLTRHCKQGKPAKHTLYLPLTVKRTFWMTITTNRFNKKEVLMLWSVMIAVLFGAVLHAIWNGLVKSGPDRFLDTGGLLLGASIVSAIAIPFLQKPAAVSWPFIAISTVLHVVYFGLIAASYQHGDMSLVYPITRGTAPAISASLAMVALHEAPSTIGLAGIALISSGVVTLAFARAARSSAHRGPVGLALLNAVLIAAYTLADGQGVRLSGSPFCYTCWGFLLWAVCFNTILAAVRGRQAAVGMKSEWKRSIVGGSCSLASYAITLWAMMSTKIALVAALRETSVLFGMIIANFALKERITPLRVAAAMFVVAGAILLKIN